MNCWSLLDSLVCLARPLLHQDIRHCMPDCPRHFVSPKESHFVNGTHARCQHELPETSAVEPVLFVSLKNFVLACCFNANLHKIARDLGCHSSCQWSAYPLSKQQGWCSVGATEKMSSRENESRIELLEWTDTMETDIRCGLC